MKGTRAGLDYCLPPNCIYPLKASGKPAGSKKNNTGCAYLPYKLKCVGLLCTNRTGSKRDDILLS